MPTLCMTRRLARLTGVVGTLFSAALALSCHSSPPAISSVNQRWSKALPWIRQGSGNSGAKQSVIVFVHGVTGNASETWSSGPTYWPDMLTRDNSFDTQDIYVYSYPSPPFKQSFSVDEVAENLRLKLSGDGVLKYRHVTFVSHSLGGVVTRAYILKYRQEIASKIRLLYFFATPTTGSPYARLAVLVSNNSQFRSLFPLHSDSYLADIQRSWLAANLHLKSYCAYEIQPLVGQLIVDQQSATALCTQHVDPIDADHISIVKPTSTSSNAYQALKSAFDETTVDSSAGDREDPLSEPPSGPKETMQPTGASDDVPAAGVGSANLLRLIVQTGSKHATDAISALRATLDTVHIQTNIVSKGDLYDYLIVVAEGGRDAATAVAVTPRGDIAAIAVCTAFTEKGAAEDAGRELAKKLAAMTR
jgi:pimeloyl-ACP methyl ester carboxylesterase